MNNLGDFDASAIIYGKFTTVQSTGAPFTLAGTPALSVYKDNSTTQSTTGVTLSVDFDSVTGLNHFTIDTSADGTFYSAGSFFDIVITTGTVNSISVVGYTVGQFTIRKTAALKPTTAGRTLDVSSGGEAGLDWANIGSPTTAQTLSGTSTKALEPTTAGRTLDVTATGEAGIDWANIGGPTTAVNLSGTTISTSQAITSVSGAVGSVTGAVGSVTGNVGGNVAGTVASVVGNVGGNVVGTVDSVVDVTTIVDGVWDEPIAGHVTAGTTGAALNAAGAAGDPWSISLPGAYGAGTAGYILGTNLDDLVSSRLAPTVAGRTIDLTTGGAAGIDWSNIENPTATVDLSDTTIKDVTDVETAISALPTAADNASALLTYADGVETGITPQGALRVILAATSGKSDGFTGLAGTVHYRNVADSKNVITAVLDSVGNRSSVTLDTS